MDHINSWGKSMTFSFVKYRYYFLSFSMLILLGGLYTYLLEGFQKGVDFTGGTVVELHSSGDNDVLKKTLEHKLKTVVTIQNLSSYGDKMVKLPPLSTNNKEILYKTLEAEHIKILSYSTLGPKMGQEMFLKGIQAILLALGAVFVYVALRFQWRYGMWAIVALVHDCLMLLSIFLMAHISLTENILIALLVTASYSINDTVVIFDRIRENKIKFPDLHTLIDCSIHETLSRTLLTSVTTSVALIVLCMWGGPIIAAFSWPILLGVVVGTYSSIFLAAPLLTLGHKNTSV